jgi:hypothetical protein
MGSANAIRALGPVWFRFTDEEDIGKYGEGWFKYDEGALLRSRARDLIALETDLGLPLVAVLNGFRDSTVLGDTAVAWIGVRLTDLSRAGDFDSFNPTTMAIEWSKTEPEPLGKDEGPETMPEPPDSDSLTPGPSESMTSVPTDTVALQAMPVAESGIS